MHSPNTRYLCDPLMAVSLASFFNESLADRLALRALIVLPNTAVTVTPVGPLANSATISVSDEATPIVLVNGRDFEVTRCLGSLERQVDKSCGALIPTTHNPTYVEKVKQEISRIRIGEVQGLG